MMATGELLSPKRIEALLSGGTQSMSRAGRNEAASNALKLSSPRRQKNPTHEDEVGELFDSNPYGQGFATDRGKREEMCSSPRSHPLMDSRQMKHYEEERMHVFGDLAAGTGGLRTCDEGNLTAKAQRAKKCGMPGLKPEVDPISREDEPKTPPPIVLETPQQTLVSPSRPVPLLSPRRVGATQSASFMSPERFVGHTSEAPPVGHYRPKYVSTENAVPGGYIPSPGSSTPRQRAEKEILIRHPEKKGLNPDGSPRTEIPAPPKKQEEQLATTMDDMISPRKAPPPEPSKESTVAFRSKQKQCDSMYIGSAAPDCFYWPRNDNATGTSPRGFVKLDQQLPRKPLVAPNENPDSYYDVMSHLKNDRSPVNMQKVSPRTQKAVEVNDLFYEPQKADSVTKPGLPNVNMGTQLPRPSMTKPTLTAELPMGAESPLHKKKEPEIDMAKQTPRKENRAAENDLIYDVSTSQISPRERGAVIRKDVPGHRPLFEPSITDNCSYNVSLDAVRPHYIQTVDFEKLSPRKEPQSHMHDLLYENTTQSPRGEKRVVGNPMMSTHLSREKRNKLLALKATSTDTVYDPIPPEKLKTSHSNVHIDFSKQVSKDCAFLGRAGPSEQWKIAHPTAPPPGTYF